MLRKKLFVCAFTICFLNVAPGLGGGCASTNLEAVYIPAEFIDDSFSSDDVGAFETFVSENKSLMFEDGMVSCINGVAQRAGFELRADPRGEDGRHSCSCKEFSISNDLTRPVSREEEFRNVIRCLVFLFSQCPDNSFANSMISLLTAVIERFEREALSFECAFQACATLHETWKVRRFGDLWPEQNIEIYSRLQNDWETLLSEVHAVFSSIPGKSICPRSQSLRVVGVEVFDAPLCEEDSDEPSAPLAPESILHILNQGGCSAGQRALPYLLPADSESFFSVVPPPSLQPDPHPPRRFYF